MSSSCRKAVACAALLAAPAAWAQQTYFIPVAEISAQYDTNREMRADSATAEKSDSYKGMLGARMGRATPRSDTELHPRVTLQEFPDRDGVDPLEYFFDLRHTYRTLKGRLGLTARYAQEDTINAELGEARFDDDGDPNTPPVAIDDTSGIVLVGQTRRSYEVNPNFSYDFSEKTSFGGGVRFQAVDYDQNVVNERVGYKSPSAEIGITRKVSPLAAFTVSPYVSRYEANEQDLPTQAFLTTDTYGLRFSLDYAWSEISRVNVTVRGERNETECDCLDPLTSSASTNWGVEIVGFRRSEVGGVRYGIGRFIAPSTLGNRRESDQIRLEYDRRLTEKLKFDAAVRLTRDQAIGLGGSDHDRDRIRGELSFTRFLTPMWYVGVGYRYAWQDLSAATGSADNHAGFLKIGVKGRDPRRGNR